MLATKSVSLEHSNAILHKLLGYCLTLTYNCIQYGEANAIRNKKGMKGFYRLLKDVDLPSFYKVAVIARACEILKSQEKSKKRGKEARHRKPLNPVVCIGGGFFVTAKGRLFISLGHEKYVDIQLNKYVQSVLYEMNVRSLTITPSSISFCYSKEITPFQTKTVYGVDRNEKNLTFGRERDTQRLDMGKVVRLKQMTREIVGSFKRNDVRIRRKISRKYWKRANDRCNQVLHDVTNRIVEAAKVEQAAIAYEDLTNIDRMYSKSNRNGRNYRFRMNQWPYGKVLRMIAYKAPWEGVTTIQLTKAETRGSSMMHFACGERLRTPERSDAVHRRMLWCKDCRVWVDRDSNAAVNLSNRGLVRLASSLPGQAGNLPVPEEGPASEVMNGNPTTTGNPGSICRQVRLGFQP